MSKGFVETFNDELAKQPKERQDQILDEVHDSLKKAGHPHFSIKALKAYQNNKNIDLIVCVNCEKHFLESEVDTNKPCKNCGE